MKIRKIIKWILLLLVMIGIGIGSLYIYKGYEMYKEVLSQTSLSEMAEKIQDNPNYSKLEHLPQTYLEAVVAVEDHRFYKHNGVDTIAIGRALLNDIKSLSFEEGGSSITQQLAKNAYFTQEKVVERKIAEAFMAFAIEGRFSKAEILELYVNSIYFGEDYYCVREASLGYFNKEPGDMTDYESTLLAGIPNAPSVYSLSASAELAAQRQRQVLKQMVKRNYLSEEESQNILNLAPANPISE